MILAAFQSFPGLVAFRFILGAFEASIAPTSVPASLRNYDDLTNRMMILVSGWWTRREQPLRNNLWYSANGIALILGSLIAWGLGHISNGALYVYQYIFLGESSLSSFPPYLPSPSPISSDTTYDPSIWEIADSAVNGSIGLISLIPVFLLLPSHITTARFLNDEQKYLALERIRLNNTGTQNTNFQWAQVRECLLDPKQWGFAVMVFCVSLVSGGISAFGPIVLSGFGLDPFQTILYNMIPGAIGIIANLMCVPCHTKKQLVADDVVLPSLCNNTSVKHRFYLLSLSFPSPPLPLYTLYRGPTTTRS